MDKKYFVYALVIFLVEIYLLVEMLWLGIVLGVGSIVLFTFLHIRNKRLKQERLHNEIERIHKSRHTDEE